LQGEAAGGAFPTLGRISEGKRCLGVPFDSVRCQSGARECDEAAVHESPVQEGTSVNNDHTDTTTDKPTQPGDAASVEHNKAVSRRWIDVFNERDDAAEADVRAPDYVAYAPVSLEPTPLDSEAWTRFLSGFVEGFRDLQLTVEDAVAEGDLVGAREVDPLGDTGSRWPPSPFFSSWVSSSCPARGCCRDSWPIS
jgi:hypothetical protein